MDPQYETLDPEYLLWILNNNFGSGVKDCGTAVKTLDPEY